MLFRRKKEKKTIRKRNSCKRWSIWKMLFAKTKEEEEVTGWRKRCGGNGGAFITSRMRVIPRREAAGVTAGRGEEGLKKRENRWRVFSARSPGWKRKRKWLANRDFSALHCLGARLAVSDELLTQGWHTTPTWREEGRRGNGEGGRREEGGFLSPCDSVSSRTPLYSSLPIREPFYLKKGRAFVCIARKDLWAMSSRSWTESLKVEGDKRSATPFSVSPFRHNGNT